MIDLDNKTINENSLLDMKILLVVLEMKIPSNQMIFKLVMVLLEGAGQDYIKPLNRHN